MPQNIEIKTTQIKAAHRYEVVEQAPIVLADKHFHFIGAGGIGNSGLAKLLLANGAIVSGSDQQASYVVDQLGELGAKVYVGHEAGNIDSSVETVVISAAVGEDNPELIEARGRGLQIYKYAEMLGELMSRYDGIAVAGTHGKSTTTAWLTFVLREAGLDPNYIVGADVAQLGDSSGTGQGRHFVAEACEYDRSFLNLRAQVAAVLNIEQDHLDYYKDEEDIIKAFADFARRMRPGGMLIANGDDANVNQMLSLLPKTLRYQTFGLSETCTYSARNLEMDNGCRAFDVYRQGMFIGRTRASLPGEHNVLNALAVFALAVQAGVEHGRILELIGQFGGVDRRLMFKDKINGITVLDDYAHHPTEVRASLSAIREQYQPSRIWCVFQPHQYSRTRFLLDDFAESFKLADVTVVPEIYFVRDSRESKQQVNAEKLVERIRLTGSEAKFIDGFGAICEYLKDNVKDGDLVVTMGAGDIWKVADEYIQRLRGIS